MPAFRKVYSYIQREKITHAIKEYVALIRNPVLKDNEYGSSSAYNITPACQLIRSSLNRYFDSTWNLAKRNFSIALENTEFTKQYINLVNLYTESIARMIAKNLQTTPGFNETIRKLISDREELGFCYALLTKDPTNPLSYSMHYLRYDQVDFTLGDGNLIKEYILSRSDDDGKIFYTVFTDITKGKKTKWKMENYYRNEKTAPVVAKNTQISVLPTTLANTDFTDYYSPVGLEDSYQEFDFCPILHSRKSINPDNLLGTGSGLMSLRSIKELHNCCVLRKDAIITNSNIFMVHRESGFKNTMGTESVGSSHESAFTKGNTSLNEEIVNETKPKSEGDRLTNQFARGALGLGTGAHGTVSLLPSALQANFTRFTADDVTKPIGDQIFFFQPNINIDNLSMEIANLGNEISSCFDSYSYFNKGQSRMTTAEIDQRSKLDALNNQDQTNPIIFDIISKYISLVVRKGSQNIFNLFKGDKDLLYHLNFDGLNEEDQQNAEQVILAVVTVLQNEDAYSIVWNDKEEEDTKNQQLVDFKNTLEIATAAAQLKQVDPDFDLHSFYKSLHTIKGIKLDTSTQQPDMTAETQAMISQEDTSYRNNDNVQG